MLSVFRNMFKVPDLRKKVLFTLFIILIYRIGSTIPVPGIDFDAVKSLRAEANNGGFVGLLSLFSGGALTNFAVFALGIMPYITSSIIMQLLTQVIPRLREWSEEGEIGRKKITQWTRYVTVGLAILQSTGIVFLFTRGSGSQVGVGTPLIAEGEDSPLRFMLIVLTLTAGTALIMWLGELITQRGVGNGMSVLIFVSVVSRLPFQGAIVFSTGGITPGALIMALGIILIAGIIFVEQGQRRIPIQYAKRVRGRRVMGGQSTYMPIKVNPTGVIPAIFASSFLYFPVLFSSLFASIPSIGEAMAGWVDRNLATGASWIYVLLFAVLIVFFAYFYTAIQYDPVRLADNIRKQGGFIPGVRPGRQTAEHFNKILTRLVLPGALYLAVLVTLPQIVLLVWSIDGVPFGGTSILITVGVALETMKQIEGQLMMRNYDGFLAKAGSGRRAGGAFSYS